MKRVRRNGMVNDVEEALNNLAKIGVLDIDEWAERMTVPRAVAPIGICYTVSVPRKDRRTPDHVTLDNALTVIEKAHRFTERWLQDLPRTDPAWSAVQAFYRNLTEALDQADEYLSD